MWVPLFSAQLFYHPTYLCHSQISCSFYLYRICLFYLWNAYRSCQRKKHSFYCNSLPSPIVIIFWNKTSSYLSLDLFFTQQIQCHLFIVLDIQTKWNLCLITKNTEHGFYISKKQSRRYFLGNATSRIPRKPGDLILTWTQSRAGFTRTVSVFPSDSLSIKQASS